VALRNEKFPGCFTPAKTSQNTQKVESAGKTEHMPISSTAMGTLTVLGVLGNAMSFVVLLRDRGRSATSFLTMATHVKIQDGGWPPS